MIRKALPYLFTLLGITIFVDAIVEGIDGVGRFAMILFGTLFVSLGLILKR